MAPLGSTASKKVQKQVFKLDSPFTATTIPQIADKDKDIIVDMLCNLLSPIGRHRPQHSTPSKGRSNRRLKRKRAPSTTPPPAPPPPALSAHLTIGLNATTRHLEALAALTKPPSTSATESGLPPTSPPTPLRPLALIILPHPHPPSSLIHAHIPTLIALSSPSPTQIDKLASPSNQQQLARLVALPTSSEARLASALHLPRLSALGILEGAPGADAVVEFVRQKVGCVEVGWLGEARLEGEMGWKGVRVRAGGEKGEKENGE